MDMEFLRLILTLAITFLLINQAIKAQPGSRRRLAFSLGAGGIGMIGALNALVAFQLGALWLYSLMIGLSLVLLTGSIIALIFAYRGGELDDQLHRARTSTAAERERREQKRQGKHR